MDLTRLTTDKGQEFYSFLSISYGFTSDCDIESESLRYLVSRLMNYYTYYKWFAISYVLYVCKCTQAQQDL